MKTHLKKSILLALATLSLLICLLGELKHRKPLLTWLQSFHKQTEPTHYNIVHLYSRQHSFLKGTLNSAGKSLLIYLHHDTDYISMSIINNQTWEPHLVAQLEEYIRENPGTQVLDAGSNLGVYSLTAAALGCRVVSVDANKNNTDRLAQSLVDNNLTENATVLLNALSNRRREFVLSFEEDNVGGQFVIENNVDVNRVKSIIMDDLRPLFAKDKPIVMKIDIQGKEIESFQSAARFFEERNIQVILIEWEWIKNMVNIEGLIDFLVTRNYKPYQEFSMENELDLVDYENWPYDIVWIKSCE